MTLNWKDELILRKKIKKMSPAFIVFLKRLRYSSIKNIYHAIFLQRHVVSKWLVSAWEIIFRILNKMVGHCCGAKTPAWAPTGMLWIKINKTDRLGSGTVSGNKKIIARTESWLAQILIVYYSREGERARQENYKSQLYKFFERTRKKSNAQKSHFSQWAPAEKSWEPLRGGAHNSQSECVCMYIVCAMLLVYMGRGR